MEIIDGHYECNTCRRSSQFVAPQASAPSASASELIDLAREVREAGFSFRTGKNMEPLACASAVPADWESFVSSWKNLGLDLYMADGGRYRRRRFAAFHVARDDIKRKPHQPHYQSRDYNSLNADIERWFEPVLPEIATNPILLNLLSTCQHVFDQVGYPVRGAPWHVEVHQFHIEALKGTTGLPTPEGMHRDGVDWVCVVLVKRENVESGTTEIYDSIRNVTSGFTLTEPLDTVLLDDSRVRHGVTPIAPLDSAGNGHRDVLVLTFCSDQK